MTQKFDAAAKFFMTWNPRDWLTLIGTSTDLEAEAIEPQDFDVDELDSDVSTVSARVDKLLRVLTDSPWIEHIEIQSFRDVRLPVRTCRYGIIAHYARKLPVRSTIILLTPEADGAELTGKYAASLPGGTQFLEYRYNIVRIWELPPEIFLQSGIGILALAPLSCINEADLPKLVTKIRKRVERELSPADQVDFWGGLAILMGLRLEGGLIDQLLKGAKNMRGSSYAQMLIEEGREVGREEGREEGREVGLLEEARKNILLIVRLRFGITDIQLESALASINELAKLEKILGESVVVQSFDELLRQLT